MKEVLLCVLIVAKTLNLKISRRLWRAASGKCTSKMRGARTARLFFAIPPSISQFSGVAAAVVFA